MPLALKWSKTRLNWLMDKAPGSSAKGKGLLYVVATPIGNLEDITLRALRVLKDVDLILAENQNRTKRLCDHHGIKTKIATYNQHSRKSRTERHVSQLNAGMNLALVSDAGTPGISDPGIGLVSAAVLEQIPTVPIPGPCAAVTALSVCGFSLSAFLFLGFLSNHPGKRKNQLKGLASEKRTMIFYESPHRIKGTLRDMAVVFASRQMMLHREMTKMFEQILRGTPGDLLERLTPENTRGEFTLVVSGKGVENDSEGLSQHILDEIEHRLKENGTSVRDIATGIAEKERLTYRKVYKACIALKETPKDS